MVRFINEGKKMDKNLNVFANQMRILKLRDKAWFLHNLKKYAILFDPKSPRDIRECPVDERSCFADYMVKNLFYKLRGHYYGLPLLKYYSLRSEKEIKEQAIDDIYHKRINAGLDAYCHATDTERKQFARLVKTPYILASIWRQKSVLDYDFR